MKISGCHKNTQTKWFFLLLPGTCPQTVADHAVLDSLVEGQLKNVQNVNLILTLVEKYNQSQRHQCCYLCKQHWSWKKKNKKRMPRSGSEYESLTHLISIVSLAYLKCYICLAITKTFQQLCPSKPYPWITRCGFISKCFQDYHAN